MTNRLTPWCWDKMAVIWGHFNFLLVWILLYSIPTSMHFYLIVQMIINQHWFRFGLDAEKATYRYLSQWWPCWLTAICVIRSQWVKRYSLFSGVDIQIFTQKWNSELVPLNCYKNTIIFLLIFLTVCQDVKINHYSVWNFRCLMTSSKENIFCATGPLRRVKIRYDKVGYSQEKLAAGTIVRL